MKYDYFNVPTQVKFWDHNGGHYIGGIAYRDEIICGCCGGIFNINEIYQFASSELDNNPIILTHRWKSIDYEICGED